VHLELCGVVLPPYLMRAHRCIRAGCLALHLELGLTGLTIEAAKAASLVLCDHLRRRAGEAWRDTTGVAAEGASLLDGAVHLHVLLAAPPADAQTPVASEGSAAALHRDQHRRWLLFVLVVLIPLLILTQQHFPYLISALVVVTYLFMPLVYVLPIAATLVIAWRFLARSSGPPAREAQGATAATSSISSGSSGLGANAA